MNNNSEPIQLALLPGMDTPMASFKERQRQAKVRLCEQNQPAPPTIQLRPEWGESQEFEVTAGGQSILVSFKAFYFSSSHHFEFRGETISPTGYRSDFLDTEQANRWGSPIEYATQKAQALNAEVLKEQKKRQRSSKLKARGQ